MGSLILFALGVAAPLVAAFVVLWIDENRRAYFKTRLERLSQDNRGLKLALDVRAPANEFPVTTDADRREINALAEQLSREGILLHWLRLGAKPPGEAAAQLLGVDENDATHLQQTIGDWGAHGVVAALGQLKERLASIAEMEMIWADPHATVERDPSLMLGRALWTFEPEFAVGEGSYAVDPRIGAIARPAAGAGLSPQGKDGDPTLVVELKSARLTIGADQQLQAWNNIRKLIRGGDIRERDPVDVYVVGGAVDELDANPRIEGRYRNVRITSFDYGQLIARAKRLTFGLYDTLKDDAPFLRQHREDIAAARAAEAGGTVRQDAADYPRRGEYVQDEPAPASSRPAHARRKFAAL